MQIYDIYAFSGKQYTKQDYSKRFVWQHHFTPIANGAITDILISHEEYQHFTPLVIAHTHWIKKNLNWYLPSSNLVTVSESCVPPRSTSLTDRPALWPTWRDQLPQLTSALTKGETKFPPRPPQTNLPQCETNRETNAATTERLAFGVRPTLFLIVDKVLLFSGIFPIGHLCKIEGLCLLSPKYRQAFVLSSTRYTNRGSLSLICFHHYHYDWGWVGKLIFHLIWHGIGQEH